MEISPDGYEYTFESSSFERWGTIALEICHKGFGQCLLMSQPQSGDGKIATRPFQLVTGRHWKGLLQGNVKAEDHGAELIKHVNNMREVLKKFIFQEENVIPLADFPEKWQSATQVPFQRAVIQFHE